MNFDTITIIPAFNEENTIANVIRGAKEFSDVLVVDDGSKDLTKEISIKNNAYLISHDDNYGYEKALETGFREAMRKGYKYVITLDGDGQHDPAIIKNIRDLLELGADLVVGVRNYHQRWAESVFSAVSYRLWRIRDPLCGMKGYRVSKISFSIDCTSYNSIGTKLAIRLASSGNKVSQLPIIVSARKDKSRFGDGFMVNVKIIKALIYSILNNKILLK
jgi:glycosyltransferase involved in cell wall biosynthesis